MKKKTLEQLNEERNKLCNEKARTERLLTVYTSQVKAIDSKVESLKSNKAALEMHIIDSGQKQERLEKEILALSEQIATYQ